MLYEYIAWKKNDTQATNSICSVYGDDSLEVSTCQNWFTRFRSGDYDLNDKEGTVRSIEVDDDLSKALLEEDPRRSRRVLESEMSVSHIGMADRLRKFSRLKI